MIQGLAITMHEMPGRAAQGAAMGVMERAFDPAFGEAWSAGQLAGMASVPGTWLTLAQLDGATLGFALIRSFLDESELLLLAVDPAFRRRRIGKTLLDHCIASARNRKIKVMHLEVRSTNGALSLYKNAGFEHVNTRIGYYRGVDDQLYDALSYRLSIE
jgi:ribosomal-protein-alanine N-acetyltransferase